MDSNKEQQMDEREEKDATKEPVPEDDKIWCCKGMWWVLIALVVLILLLVIVMVIIESQGASRPKKTDTVG